MLSIIGLLRNFKESVIVPIYDKATKKKSVHGDIVEPTQIIILEGHYLFSNLELMKIMNCKIYLDTDDDVRLSRMVLKTQQDKVNGLQKLKDLLKKYEK